MQRFTVALTLAKEVRISIAEFEYLTSAATCTTYKGDELKYTPIHVISMLSRSRFDNALNYPICTLNFTGLQKSL